jgi:hypothetical protein
MRSDYKQARVPPTTKGTIPPVVSLQQVCAGMGDSCSSLHSTFAVQTPVSSPSQKAGTGKRLSESPQERSEDENQQRLEERPRPLRVSFDETIRVKETLHINDFSEEEYCMYWITSDEQVVILNMADITTELMCMGALEDGENICFRGLEGKTEQANQEYSEKYLGLINAIIMEQEQSSSNGTLDHDRIATLYQEWTCACKQLAWQRGQLDEYHARMDDADAVVSQQADSSQQK